MAVYEPLLQMKSNSISPLISLWIYLDKEKSMTHISNFTLQQNFLFMDG